MNPYEFSEQEEFERQQFGGGYPGTTYYPGHSHGGMPPGHGGWMPGHGGMPPGHGGWMPGHGGMSPGQGGWTPTPAKPPKSPKSPSSLPYPFQYGN